MSDSYSYVKIHNAQRRDKLDRKRDANYYTLTPPKYLSKKSLLNTYNPL